MQNLTNEKPNFANEDFSKCIPKFLTDMLAINVAYEMMVNG